MKWMVMFKKKILSFGYNYNTLPDFGPIDIPDYNEFLLESREVFKKQWDSPMKESGFTLQDYKKLKLIGSGSFGNVYLVQNLKNKHFHAMKAILKETILKYKQLDHTKTEKLVLKSINCPFALRLQDFFKDNSYIYFILPFVQGGELFVLLHRSGKFEEIAAMFYVSQVVLGLEYLHFVDIVYRDIKPENIMVDHTGYVKLTDFGFCKHIEGRTYTMCGTPEYIAPEVILGKGYGKSVDWWGVGILMFELAAGFSPFKEHKSMKVYEKILRGAYKMPPHFSTELRDLVRNILQADTSKRYGNLKNGVNDIKEHLWFRPLNWHAVLNRKAKSPYVPVLSGPDDITHFRQLNYKSLEIEDQEPYREQFANF